MTTDDLKIGDVFVFMKMENQMLDMSAYGKGKLIYKVKIGYNELGTMYCVLFEGSRIYTLSVVRPVRLV